MKSFFALALAGAASAEALSADFLNFIDYVAKYNKSYESVEDFEHRLEQFVQTHAFIKENNTSGSSHVAGHNKFSDWTLEEFKAFQGLRSHHSAGLEVSVKTPELKDTPASVDWRTDNKVSAVKDQSSCGSCWAFSTTGAVESAFAIKNNTDVTTLFSEQQLVDCAGGEFLNGGCNGGWYYWAYQYLREYGFETEGDYAYTGKDGTCAYDASKEVAGSKVASYNLVTDLGTGGERSAITAAIAQGPANVAVAAGNRYFQTYSSGILTSTSCPIEIDHAILAVGYGQEDGTWYYIVKNSWGSGWGEDGYIRIEATEDGAGICGVNQYVVIPNME